MKIRLHTLLFLLFLVPAGAWAVTTELTQAELRAAVADSDAISTRRLISGVEDFTGGAVVDIRAFDVDGVVTYRILVRHDNGQVTVLMVDGTSGRAVSTDSDVGKQVAAASAASNGKSQLTNSDNANANANGRSNRNNGRGNGGSNGRGNSGTNGNDRNN